MGMKYPTHSKLHDRFTDWCGDLPAALAFALVYSLFVTAPFALITL